MNTLEAGNAVSSLASRFAPRIKSKIIQIADENGDIQEFVIKRFAGVSDYTDMSKKIEGRIKALRTFKGKLKVAIDPGQIAGIEDMFPDLFTEGDKSFINIISEAEIMTASHLEHILEAPQMSWSDAAIFTRVAGMVAATILAEFNAFNTVEALQDAKNE